MGARAMFANVKHGLILSSGMCISASQASLFGLTGLVERMSQELIAKMTELQVDSFELACLRGIILFNPGKWCFATHDFSVSINSILTFLHLLFSRCEGFEQR